MGPRSKIEQLPEAVRKELNQKLIGNSFSDYDGLEKWLDENGFKISKSSIHRYGIGFEDKLARLNLATEQARAITEAAPDDEGAMNDALFRLIQEKVFKFLVDMGDIKNANISSLGRMVAELGKASINQKKWMVEVRQKVDKAAEAVKDKALAGGVPPDMAQMFKDIVSGSIT